MSFAAVNATSLCSTMLIAPPGQSVAVAAAAAALAAARPEAVILRYGTLYGQGTWNSRDGKFGQTALDESAVAEIEHALIPPTDGPLQR